MLPTRPLPALIQGDAREVLRQLAADGLAGEVKLAYLDPPYNTRRSHRFRGHYQDNRTKPDWAALIEEVLSGVRDLLREDGSAWLQINASELGAAQQVAEKVFGRCFKRSNRRSGESSLLDLFQGVKNRVGPVDCQHVNGAFPAEKRLRSLSREPRPRAPSWTVAAA
jgi:hypothetical protein